MTQKFLYVIMEIWPGGRNFPRYAFEDEGYAIAAWPGAEDGWDEALPPSIATADKSLRVYRIHDLVQAVMFLTARADVVRSTSNPREFDDIA